MTGRFWVGGPVDRKTEALSREMRQLMILAFLRALLPNWARPGDIKDALYGRYPCNSEEAIHRRFSEDMDGLRRAGLIDYDELRPTRRVVLAAPQKNPMLYLTLEEHRALAEARLRLGGTTPPGPVDGDTGPAKLAAVVRALRLIEEGNTEVDNRIGLIDAALSAGAAPRDIGPLRSARAKLATWRERLQST